MNKTGKQIPTLVACLIGLAGCMTSPPTHVHAVWDGPDTSEPSMYTVQIGPENGRLSLLNLEGNTLALAMIMSPIVDTQVGAIRWRLGANNSPLTPWRGGLVSTGGHFLPPLGEMHVKEGPDVLIFAGTVLGNFCSTEEVPSPDCIPCDFNEGCDLTVSVDACGAPADHDNYQEAMFQILRADKRTDHAKCHLENDVEECEGVRDWVEITAAPLGVDVCGLPLDELNAEEMSAGQSAPVEADGGTEAE